jgi:hypothetical protein
VLNGIFSGTASSGFGPAGVVDWLFAPPAPSKPLVNNTAVQIRSFIGFLLRWQRRGSGWQAS